MALEDLTEWNTSELVSYFEVDDELNNIWKLSGSIFDWDWVLTTCNDKFIYTPEQLEALKDAFMKEFEEDYISDFVSHFYD